VDPDAAEVAAYINAALAAELRAAKAILNITQQRLSDESGIPMRTLTRVLAGDRDIDVRQLGALAGPLGVSPADLIERATKRAENLAAVSGLSEDEVKTRYDTAANPSSEDDPTHDDEPV
jgi:transcriptional regulator with XRE-family HTH domain